MTKPPKIPESVLVVIHTPALDVLVIKRADQPDFWQSVTGSKDALDEPIAQVAAREVAEETGIVVGGPGSRLPRSSTGITRSSTRSIRNTCTATRPASPATSSTGSASRCRRAST